LWLSEVVESENVKCRWGIAKWIQV